MNVVTVPLPANKSYAVRSATLITVSDRPLIGVVEVREQVTEHSKVKSSKYAIRGDRADGPERIHRLTKPGGEEFYFVCLDDRVGSYDQCGCLGFSKAGWCKHTAALRALADAGHLPDSDLPSHEK